MKKEKITIQWVREQIKEIERAKGDDEVAHSREDNLYLIVLEEVAKGHPQSQELAKEVLKTKKIDFARWHA